MKFYLEMGQLKSNEGYTETGEERAVPVIFAKKCNQVKWWKTVFLRSKYLEKHVIVRPLRKAETKKIWKLKKYFNDLPDTLRYWYLKARKERCKQGTRPSKLEQGIFIFVNILRSFESLFCLPVTWYKLENQSWQRYW